MNGFLSPALFGAVLFNMHIFWLSASGVLNKPVPAALGEVIFFPLLAAAAVILLGRFYEREKGSFASFILCSVLVFLGAGDIYRGAVFYSTMLYGGDNILPLYLTLGGAVILGAFMGIEGIARSAQIVLAISTAVLVLSAVFSVGSLNLLNISSRSFLGETDIMADLAAYSPLFAGLVLTETLKYRPKFSKILTFAAVLSAVGAIFVFYTETGLGVLRKTTAFPAVTLMFAGGCLNGSVKSVMMILYMFWCVISSGMLLSCAIKYSKGFLKSRKGLKLFLGISLFMAVSGWYIKSCNSAESFKSVMPFIFLTAVPVCTYFGGKNEN